MTYIFSDIPANLARFCANRPIHFIVSTVLVASFAYLAIFDDYIENTYQLPETLTFYHAAGNSNASQWHLTSDIVDFEESDKYSHLYLTPIKFKTYDSESIPIYPSFLSGADATEKFLLSDSEEESSKIPNILTNKQDIQFKLRTSNKFGKYFEYFKFLISRFKNLILGAEPFDIILVTIAYSAMWFTFFQLFYEMKKLGSNFWLAFGSLLSSGFAFLFALAVTTEVLHIRVPLISLSEGLPFLVATIGFKHKLAFTAPVLQALRFNSNRDISEIIADVVRSKTAVPLIRDQLILSASFLVCSFCTPGLIGLRNFCILSAIILAVDLLFTFTFYASILSLKAQISKVHQEVELKEALEEDGISENVAKSVAGLSGDSPKGIFKQNSSIVGFKIAMLAGFLGLHLFALGTSWLYDDSADYEPVSLLDFPANSISKYYTNSIPIGPYGALITLLPTKVYRQVTPFTEVEDYVSLFFSKLFTAISDPLVSKFLFMIAGISVAINIYLLNVARLHFSSSSLPIKQVVDKRLPDIDTFQKKKNKGKGKSKAKKNMAKKENKYSKPSTVELASASFNSENVKVGQIIEDISTGEDSSSDYTELTNSEEESIRPLDDLVDVLKAGNVKECNNTEVTELVTQGKLPLYALEKQLGDRTRAVVVRRLAIAKLANAPVLLSEKLPYRDYDYDRVFGACCENVIGYIPIPLGVAGPMIIDGIPYHIPVATTEGCLVASTMRGCKAINAGGGAQTVLTADGMTRGPCVQFPNLIRAGFAKQWLDSEEGQKRMKTAFNSTSRFARLQHIKTAIAGDLLFIRFKTTTGDAMGMNMISKGVEHSLKCMVEDFGFEDMEVVSVSGNYCIDKKAAAINWIEGRGKSVVASADIPEDIVKKVLKSDVDALVDLNVSKNLVGSALAGAVGGFNAHAANLVTAVYLATGQDPAQNVESSNCITLMKRLANGDLRISVSMPCIEVGTIGGGTVLEPQGAMLEMLGIRGPHPTEPGANARQLAKIVASAVLAAELSLCSALAAGHLVQSHMQHNRKAPASTVGTSTTSTVSLEKQGDVERLKEGSKICIRS